MAKGIDIAIAADTRSAMSAINRGLIDPLEDVSEILETVGKEGPDATDKLERGMRDAQRRTDDAKDEIRDLRDELNKAGRAGKNTGDDIGRGMRDGADDMRRFGDQAGEVGDELRQNLGETFSSFRGDLEDLPQIAQDTLGGLAGSGALGGIPGLAATAAGAAGLGLVIGAIDTISQEAEEAKAYANELAQAYIDAGSTILDSITAAARIGDVITDDEQLEKAKTLADALGVDLAEAVRIVAGDTNALTTAQKSLADEQIRLNDIKRETTDATFTEALAYQDEQVALDAARSALEPYTAATESATEKARLHSDALKSMLADAGNATVQVDDLGNKLYTLPDGHQIVIDAKTGIASDNIDRFKGNVDTVPKTVTTTAVFEADTSQFDREVRRVSNTTIRIGARIVTSGQGWDQ